MVHRQVDVMDKAGTVLQTYPISLGADTSPRASDFERAALKQAGAAKLVPDSDVAHLTARMQRKVAAPARADAQPKATAQPAAPLKN